MPIRTVKVSATEAAALRELTNRFRTSELARKAAVNAVRIRCARLSGRLGKNEVAVLCRSSNQIDVLDRDEYVRDYHKNLWVFEPHGRKLSPETEHGFDSRPTPLPDRKDQVRERGE